MIDKAYERVGPKVDIDDVALSDAGAARFHYLASIGPDIKQFEREDTHTRIVSAAKAPNTLTDPLGDMGVPDDLYTARSYHHGSVAHEGAESITPYSRSKIDLVRFRQNHGSQYKIYNTSVVEQVDGRIVTARRTVRITQAIAERAMSNNGELYEREVSVRKSYERVINDEDIDDLESRIRRIFARHAIVCKLCEKNT